MRERFTAEQWETLLFAPIFANYATAMADGATDVLESRALAEAISRALTIKDDLTREICQTLAFDAAATITRARDASVTRSPGEVITEAARLADSVNRPGSPTPYKRFLLDLCLATAEASGPSGGPKVAAQERGTIQVMRKILNLPE